MDFNNDCVGDSLLVCRTMFDRYRSLMRCRRREEAERYRLYGVRLDTSASLRDVSVPPLGDPALDLGVNPRLVFTSARRWTRAWESWDLPAGWRERARDFCRSVRDRRLGRVSTRRRSSALKSLACRSIFTPSARPLFDNHGRTVTDYTADVVRIKVHGEWVDMAKVGRRPRTTPIWNECGEFFVTTQFNRRKL